MKSEREGERTTREVDQASVCVCMFVCWENDNYWPVNRIIQSLRPVTLSLMAKIVRNG